MIKRPIALLLLTVLLIVMACATPVHSPTETTPREKLTYMYQIYNAQHEDYMVMSGNPNLTGSQKDMLRAKKPILETLQTLIPAYDMQVQLGSPTIEQEQEIYNLLTQLQNMSL